MTTRAIFWCGHVRPPPSTWHRDERGKRAVAPNDAMYDRAAQINGLELAFQAAHALGARLDDIHACVCDDLLPRELGKARLPATLEALQQVTKTLERHAKDDDALLFIATNHGENARGLLTEPPSPIVDELDDPTPFLTPATLDACLAAIPGRQAVVIAACYAGQFLALRARPERVVLAACSADEPYWIHKADEGACSAFLAEFFAAWCGVGLPRTDGIIPRDRLPLDDAFARAAERLAAAGSRNTPVRAGAARW